MKQAPLTITPLLAPTRRSARVREAREQVRRDNQERLLLALSGATIVASDLGAPAKPSWRRLDLATDQARRVSAQLHIQLGVIELLAAAHDAHQHAWARARGWHEADAFAPQSLLVQGLRAMASRLLPGEGPRAGSTLVDAGADRCSRPARSRRAVAPRLD